MHPGPAGRDSTVPSSGSSKWSGSPRLASGSSPGQTAAWCSGPGGGGAVPDGAGAMLPHGVLPAGTLGFGGVTLLSLAERLDSFSWGPGVG